jgi:hypothetical protein
MWRFDTVPRRTAPKGQHSFIYRTALPQEALPTPAPLSIRDTRSLKPPPARRLRRSRLSSIYSYSTANTELFLAQFRVHVHKVVNQRSMWRFDTVPRRMAPKGQHSFIYRTALPQEALPTPAPLSIRDTRSLEPPPRKATPEVQTFLHLLVQHHGHQAHCTPAPAFHVHNRNHTQHLHSGLGYKTPNEVYTEYLNRQLAA